MTKEELESILAAALKPVNDKIDALEATRIEAANLISSVEPHCASLEAAADNMEKAGIGGHPEQGHPQVLRRMAGRMRAEAAMGKIPHIFRDHDYPTYASADRTTAAAEDPAVKALKDEIAGLKTLVTDLKAAAADQKPAPERKTLSPQITAILAKHELQPGSDGKIEAGALDTALKHLPVTERLRIKASLGQAGVLA